MAHAGGRPPKPTYLKVLEGNPGRRPINENEPKRIISWENHQGLKKAVCKGLSKIFGKQ